MGRQGLLKPSPFSGFFSNLLQGFLIGFKFVKLQCIAADSDASCFFCGSMVPSSVFLLAYIPEFSFLESGAFWTIIPFLIWSRFGIRQIRRPPGAEGLGFHAMVSFIQLLTGQKNWLYSHHFATSLLASDFLLNFDLKFQHGVEEEPPNLELEHLSSNSVSVTYLSVLWPVTSPFSFVKSKDWTRPSFAAPCNSRNLWEGISGVSKHSRILEVKGFSWGHMARRWTLRCSHHPLHPCCS